MVCHFKKKITHRNTTESSDSTSGYLPQRIESRDSDTCTPLFIAAVVTTARRWEQSRCPWVDEWMNKMWSIHTMDHESALKREEIVTPATTCLTPDYIMLSETSQTKKDKYYLISLI